MLRIEVYAQLKDFFPSSFEVEGVTDITGLKQLLTARQAEAGALLSSCRFAVNADFIDPLYKFDEHDTIVIIPPSSGG